MDLELVVVVRPLIYDIHFLGSTPASSERKAAGH